MSAQRSCNVCGVDLILGQTWTAGQATAYNYICRGCMSLRGRTWSATHKERVADLQRARIAANPERYAKIGHEYRLANKEKFRASVRANRARRKAADDGMSVSAAGMHPLVGRPQSPEHVAKRIATMARTLAASSRECHKCGEIFTPTTAAQVYCSGQCWNSVARKKRRNPPRIPVSSTKYAELRAIYRNQCQVCQVEGRSNERKDRLAVDHDHITGEIRGLLCHRCNTALGLLNDSADIAHQAFRYLAYHTAARKERAG
jgi:hypothetical protein